MSNVVEILVKGTDQSGAKTMDKVATGAKKAGAETKKAAGGLGIFKMAAAGVAGAGLIEFFKGANDEARESQKVGAQTTAVIKSTGGAAKVTADQIGDLATAISNKTGIDDEQIQSGANMLLTFTNIRNEVGKGNDIFNQATQTVTDMSAALGQDTKNSAIQLGKALNDPIRGVTALSRVGVTFTNQQKEQIRTLVESGNTLGAQKIILGELSREFGGSAEAQATAGDKLKTSWNNFKEAVGTALLPVLDKLANWGVNKGIPMLNKLLDYVQKNSGAWKQELTPAFQAAVSAGKDVAHTLKEILDFLGKHPALAKAAALGVGGLGLAYKTANGPLGTFLKLIGSFSGKAGGAGGAGGKLSGILGKLGLAAAGAAGIVTGLNKVFNDNAEHAAGSASVMESLTNSFTKSKGKIDATVKSAQQYNLESTGIAKRAAQSGISIDQLTTALVGPRKGFDDLITVWKKMGDPSAQTLDAFRSLRTQMFLAQDQVKATGQAFDDLDTTQAKLRVQQFQQAIDDIKQGKVPGLTANNAAGKAKIQEMQDRITDIKQHRPPGLTAKINAAKASIREMQAKINAIKQGKVPGLTATNAAGKQRIRDLQGKINTLKGKTVPVGVSGVGAANAALDSLIAKIGDLNSKPVKGGSGVPGLPNIPGLHDTGGVWRGRHYDTGGAYGSVGSMNERGPEIVRLPDGSMIYPAGQSQQMASQWGGGPTVINLELGGGASDFDRFMLEWIRRRVRVLGGNVQLAFGGARAAG